MSEIIELINSRKFASIKDKVLSLLADSIRVRTEIVPREKIEIGSSKIGGAPDLPKDFNWPENENLPLSFIAQFNLSELSEYDEKKAFPPSGMLYFFYDTIRFIVHDCVYDENYNEVSEVLYFEGDSSQLSRIPPPKQLVDIREDLWDSGIFRACAVKFSKEKDLPRYRSIILKDLELKDKEEKLYISLYSEISKFYNRKQDKMRRLPIYITHRLLGYSDGIDNNMEIDCQLRLEGSPWKEIHSGEKYTNLDESEKSRLDKESIKWRQLFQIDSDYKTQMEWGDVGRIFVFIQRDALKKRDFSTTYAFYQG